MPRVKPKSIGLEERNKLLGEFWTMVALLESREEVKNFFKDLLSETEAIMLARRIQIAKMLLVDSSYEEIRHKLQAGESTIASVHRWLQSGFGGYEKLLPRLQKELERKNKVVRQKLKSREPFTAEWLKRKYPLHYLLVNLLDWIALKPPKKLRKR